MNKLRFETMPSDVSIISVQTQIELHIKKNNQGCDINELS